MDDAYHWDFRPPAVEISCPRPTRQQHYLGPPRPELRGNIRGESGAKGIPISNLTRKFKFGNTPRSRLAFLVQKDSAFSSGDNSEISSACFVMLLVESWCPGLRQRDANWFIIQLFIPVRSYSPQHPQIQGPNTQTLIHFFPRSKTKHTKNGRPRRLINKPQNSAMPSVSPPLVHLFIDGPLHL